MSGEAEARLAVELAELAGRRTMAAWRLAEDPAARRLIREAYDRCIRAAPRVAWFTLRNRADREAILAAPVPPRYAAMPRGAAIFRDYAAAVSEEFRRQQLTFDRYATMTSLHAHVAALPPPEPRKRSLQLDDYGVDDTSPDPGQLVSGYTPEFDPGTVLPIQIDTYDAAGATALRRLGAVGFDFHLEDPTILREIQALQLDRIVGIDATTIDGLRKVLVRAAGGTVVDIAKAIRDYWDQASTRRALVIAHTEMAFASASAERDTYRRNGIEQVEFSGNASLDDGRDETNCNNYLGAVYPVDSSEAGGLIPLHPLCTHYWAPVFPADWNVPAMPWAGGNLDLGGGPSVDTMLSGEWGRAARWNPHHVPVSIRRVARLDLRERQAAAASSGVMVAFMLPLVARAMLALPGGEPSGDLHVTLAFLGKTDVLGDPAPLRQAVAAFAGEAPPMAATVTGVGRFTAVDAGDPHPVVALIDCPGLESFRHALLLRLREAGYEADGTHGFLPHATLQYIPADAPTPIETLPPLRLSFVDITLAVGALRHTWPLKGLQ